MENKIKKGPACGRTINEIPQYCSNQEYSWKSNKLHIEKIGLYWENNKLYFNVNYVITCKKCGHKREQGSVSFANFIRKVIKQQIFGELTFI